MCWSFSFLIWYMTNIQNNYNPAGIPVSKLIRSLAVIDFFSLYVIQAIPRMPFLLLACMCQTCNCRRSTKNEALLMLPGHAFSVVYVIVNLISLRVFSWTHSCGLTLVYNSS